MSIYSGFATRQQEQTYDQLVEDVLFVFQKRIMKFYRGEDTNEEKFLDVLVHLHQQMAKMQESKYLEPKSSKSIEELLRFLIVNANRADGKHLHKQDHVNLSRQHSANKNAGVQSTNTVLSKNYNYLTKLQHEHHSSIGKIVHQIKTNEDNNSLANSRNTFINKPEGRLPVVNEPTNVRDQVRNPEDHSLGTKKQQPKGRSRFASSNEPNKTNFTSIGGEEGSKKRNELLDYLDKQNKNYLRGYRKRSVKSRNYSKELSDLLGTGRKLHY